MIVKNTTQIYHWSVLSTNVSYTGSIVTRLYPLGVTARCPLDTALVTRLMSLLAPLTWVYWQGPPPLRVQHVDTICGLPLKKNICIYCIYIPDSRDVFLITWVWDSNPHSIVRQDITSQLYHCTITSTHKGKCTVVKLWRGVLPDKAMSWYPAWQSYDVVSRLTELWCGILPEFESRALSWCFLNNLSGLYKYTHLIFYTIVIR